MHFLFLLIICLASITPTLSLPKPPTSNSDLPPLIEGEQIPDEYLCRAGFDLNTLYNTSPGTYRCPEYSYTYYNRNTTISRRDNHVDVPMLKPRQGTDITSSVCETSINSPLQSDVYGCVSRLPLNNNCMQGNPRGSSCTTMKKYKSAAIGICGNFWDGSCRTLVPYLIGIANSCVGYAASGRNQGKMVVQGKQSLNWWDNGKASFWWGDVHVIVFHS